MSSIASPAAAPKLAPTSGTSKTDTQLTPDQIKQFQDMDKSLGSMITKMQSLVAQLPHHDVIPKDKDKAKDQLEKYGPLNRALHKLDGEVKTFFHKVGHVISSFFHSL
ncbi:hypothetical protein SOPP22_01295 [Shewanella sp. OPT22]|nr:hypothetical protein SOPP22_01295 [Shewanella sp. OPT22]